MSHLWKWRYLEISPYHWQLLSHITKLTSGWVSRFDCPVRFLKVGCEIVIYDLGTKIITKPVSHCFDFCVVSLHKLRCSKCIAVQFQNVIAAQSQWFVTIDWWIIYAQIVSFIAKIFMVYNQVIGIKCQKKGNFTSWIS